MILINTLKKFTSSISKNNNTNIVNVSVLQNIIFFTVLGDNDDSILMFHSILLLMLPFLSMIPMLLSLPLIPSPQLSPMMSIMPLLSTQPLFYVYKMFFRKYYVVFVHYFKSYQMMSIRSYVMMLMYYFSTIR